MADEWPKTVYTTFRPDEAIEVDEAEYTDLSRQGLLARTGEESERTAEKLRAAQSRKEG